jgi:hypothetical protein
VTCGGAAYARVFVGFADDCWVLALVFVLFVFFVIIVRDRENLLDAIAHFCSKRL